MSTAVHPFIEYEPGSKVSCAHIKEVIDQAIALPGVLESDDGRLFHIHGWTAYVRMGEAITVTATLLVSFPKGAPK